MPVPWELYPFELIKTKVCFMFPVHLRQSHTYSIIKGRGVNLKLFKNEIHFLTISCLLNLYASDDKISVS